MGVPYSNPIGPTSVPYSNPDFTGSTFGTAKSIRSEAPWVMGAISTLGDFRTTGVNSEANPTQKFITWPQLSKLDRWVRDFRHHKIILWTSPINLRLIFFRLYT
ncbi:hypothetical protein CsSME_00050724 [Camellia sinensis var. sinensis]